MNVLSLRRPAALLCSLVAFTLAITSAAGAGAPPAAPLPVLGVDPLPQGVVIDNHADVIARWVGMNVVAGILLHVDTNDALGSLEPGKTEAIRALVGRRDVAGLLLAGRAGKSGLFRDENFVRAAARLGLIREIVWVVPFSFIGDADAGPKLKRVISREGWSAEEIESFRAAEGCYRGRMEGLPMTICSQERLPVLDASVLLSLGSDYVPVAAVQRGISVLEEIQGLSAALRAAHYSVRDAVVANPVQRGRMPVNLRWVGEAMVDSFRTPALTLGDQPPERWVLLQKLYQWSLNGQQGEGELLNGALSGLEKHPHDPALLVYAAEASARHGGGEAALKYAEQACSVDPGYCVALREFGLKFVARGKLDIGGRFFATEQRLQPGMEYEAFRKGIALLWLRDPVEALKAFEIAGNEDGGFPSGFMIGALHAAAGDRAAARLAFDRACVLFEQSPGLAVMQLEVAHAIEKAVDFYREEGLVSQAERLAADPRLRTPRPEGAP